LDPFWISLSAVDLFPAFFEELARHHNHALSNVDACFASVAAGDEVL
jgi:hypothetical protein